MAIYTEITDTHTRHTLLGSNGNRDPLQCWRNEKRQQDMGDNKISSPLACTSLNQHRGAVDWHLMISSQAHEVIPYTDHHSSISQINISVLWDMCLCAKLELMGGDNNSLNMDDCCMEATNSKTWMLNTLSTQQHRRSLQSAQFQGGNPC